MCEIFFNRMHDEIHGYHVYGKNWSAVLQEEPYYKQKLGYVINCYIVAVTELGELVGHLLQKNSKHLQHFSPKRRNCSYSYML